jgi:hypothetical protein
MTLTVHYSRISLIGSSLVGIVIALPTLLLYKVETIKAGAVFFFFLAAILATRLILWIWNPPLKRTLTTFVGDTRLGDLQSGDRRPVISRFILILPVCPARI